MTSRSCCVRDLSRRLSHRLCTLLSHHAISINRLLNRFEELLSDRASCTPRPRLRGFHRQRNTAAAGGEHDRYPQGLSL
jgi:hypothetical protein